MLTETQEELEESLKALVSQNNNLVELLEKANIKVPHFVGPKLLSFIITVHESQANDENENANIENKTDISTRTVCEKSQSKPENENELIQKKSQNDTESNGHTDVDLLKKSNGTSINQPNILPEIKEVQSFGSVDLIPVSSSSVIELKVHEKPVKNFVEITPLPSNQSENVHSKPEKTGDLVQSKEQANHQGMFKYFLI